MYNINFFFIYTLAGDYGNDVHHVIPQSFHKEPFGTLVDQHKKCHHSNKNQKWDGYHWPSLNNDYSRE